MSGKKRAQQESQEWQGKYETERIKNEQLQHELYVAPCQRATSKLYATTKRDNPAAFNAAMGVAESTGLVQSVSFLNDQIKNDGYEELLKVKNEIKDNSDNFADQLASAESKYIVKSAIQGDTDAIESYNLEVWDEEQGKLVEAHDKKALVDTMTREIQASPEALKYFHEVKEKGAAAVVGTLNSLADTMVKATDLHMNDLADIEKKSDDILNEIQNFPDKYFNRETGEMTPDGLEALNKFGMEVEETAISLKEAVNVILRDPNLSPEEKRIKAAPLFSKLQQVTNVNTISKILVDHGADVNKVEEYIKQVPYFQRAHENVFDEQEMEDFYKQAQAQPGKYELTDKLREEEKEYNELLEQSPTNTVDAMKTYKESLSQSGADNQLIAEFVDKNNSISKKDLKNVLKSHYSHMDEAQIDSILSGLGNDEGISLDKFMEMSQSQPDLFNFKYVKKMVDYKQEIEKTNDEILTLQREKEAELNNNEYVTLNKKQREELQASREDFDKKIKEFDNKKKEFISNFDKVFDAHIRGSDVLTDSSLRKFANSFDGAQAMGGRISNNTQLRDNMDRLSRRQIGDAMLQHEHKRFFNDSLDEMKRMNDVSSEDIEYKNKVIGHSTALADKARNDIETAYNPRMKAIDDRHAMLNNAIKDTTENRTTSDHSKQAALKNINDIKGEIAKTGKLSLDNIRRLQEYRALGNGEFADVQLSKSKTYIETVLKDTSLFTDEVARGIFDITDGEKDKMWKALSNNESKKMDNESFMFIISTEDKIEKFLKKQQDIGVQIFKSEADQIKFERDLKDADTKVRQGSRADAEKTAESRQLTDAEMDDAKEKARHDRTQENLGMKDKKPPQERNEDFINKSPINKSGTANKPSADNNGEPTPATANVEGNTVSADQPEVAVPKPSSANVEGNVAG